MLVRKKDGTVRFCVDYRRLNAVTIKDAYPLPRIADAMDALGGARYFCCMDMKSGFWQVPLDDDAKEKSAFINKCGFFQYKVMPFGMANAPATFQRLMELVLTGLNWRTCLVYMDDVLVFGNSFDECLGNLSGVLAALRQANLKAKPSKCKFFASDLTWLGHEISTAGVRPDPGKVDAVAHWPTPENLTEVRSFLGTASYYRRWIKGFATIAAPLHDLMRKDTKWNWTPQCQASFEQLRDALCSAPVLAHPTEDGQFILDTDASNTGLGGALSQIQDGDERAVAFASKSLSRSQRNYCATNRELLGVVTMVQYFRHYLLGRPFLIRTDHSSLRWLTNFKKPEGLLARWIAVLGNYDYTIEHRPGEKHGNADGLSRRPRRRCGQDFCQDCPNLKNERELLPVEPEYPELPPISAQGEESVRVNVIQGILGEESILGEEGLTSELENPESSEDPLPVDISPAIDIPFEEDTMRIMRTLPLSPEQEEPVEVQVIDDASVPFDLLDTSNRESIPDENATESLAPEGEATEIEEGPREARGSDGMKKSTKRGLVAFDEMAYAGLEGRAPSLEVIRDLQAKDETTQKFIQLKRMYGREKPPARVRQAQSEAVKALIAQWPIMAVEDNLLYRCGYGPDQQVLRRQLYLPPKLRLLVFYCLHASPVSGHLGEKRMQARMMHRYYWPGYTSDIIRWCQQCHTCQQRKPGMGKAKNRLYQVPATYPLERVHLDVLTVKPASHYGNTHILVVTDSFTRWTEAYPIWDQKAATIADKLVREFICRFGVPHSIHTDQHPDFESALFQEVMRLLDIDKTRTSPYRPQSDGQPERFNRTLIAMLSMFVQENQADWEDVLPYVMMAYRSTVHDTTGCSPCLMMLGRELGLPLDITRGPPPGDPSECTVHYTQQLQQKLRQAHEVAQIMLTRRTAHQKRMYDRKARPRRPEIGKWVWYYYTPFANKKLALPWTGPYLVIDLPTEVTAAIQMTPSSPVKIVHVDYLKEVRGRTPISWLKPRQAPLEVTGPRLDLQGVKDQPKAMDSPDRETSKKDEKLPDVESGDSSLSEGEVEVESEDEEEIVVPKGKTAPSPPTVYVKGVKIVQPRGVPPWGLIAPENRAPNVKLGQITAPSGNCPETSSPYSSVRKRLFPNSLDCVSQAEHCGVGEGEAEGGGAEGVARATGLLPEQAGKAQPLRRHQLRSGRVYHFNTVLSDDYDGAEKHSPSDDSVATSFEIIPSPEATGGFQEVNDNSDIEWVLDPTRPGDDDWLYTYDY